MKNSLEQPQVEHGKENVVDKARLERELHGLWKNPKTIEALISLVEQLRDKFDEYDTIISDEASGRLPSLLMRKLANHTRPQGGEIPLIFLSRDGNMKAVKDRGDKSGKILLITEIISSGDSVGQLVRRLNDLGIFDIDVATVTSSPSRKERLDELHVNLFTGDVVRGGGGGVSFYNRQESTGVEKRSTGEIKISERASREMIKHARKDMDLLYQELSKLLDKPTDKKN